MRVFCDFDGTISLQDTTDRVLERFATPDWKDIEVAWEKGEIGSAECMRRQISCVRASLDELDRFLDDVEIDQTFLSFVSVCQTNDIPLTVISDGVDYFISRILKKYGLSSLPVIANHLMIKENQKFELSSPHAVSSCSAKMGVCKCSKMSPSHLGNQDVILFIGDGRSDFCAAGNADVIFAKSALLDYCKNHNWPHYPYTSFLDVQRVMDEMRTVHLGCAASKNSTFHTQS